MAVCEVCGRPIIGECLHEVNETFWEEYLICENCIETYRTEKEIQLSYGAIK